MQNNKKRILFVGHCYYNHWYLSREMRKLGWKADVLNVEIDTPNQAYYHGEDFGFNSKFSIIDFFKQFLFYFNAIFRYQIFVFSGINYLRFGHLIEKILSPIFGKGAEIKLLKLIGKKIVYHNNGCRDGVLQSSFSKWLPFNVCSICPDRNNSNSCSDHLNAKWGNYRNSMADVQLLLGGNRADFNIGNNIFEAPWSYSLDKNLWTPKKLIPANYLLPFSKNTVKLYHSVGNFDDRIASTDMPVTIKSTHTYIEVVQELKKEGVDVELIFFKDVPNKKIIYYMSQADIVVDMLTFGFFGGNVREGLMMGKPVVCFLRQEWLEMAKIEIPDFINELPIVNANPNNIKLVLHDLIINKEKRIQIGRSSREFALKWFASDNAAKQADIFFSKLIS